MIWPPVKAWTSKFNIENQFHFVAINYGGKGIARWVVLMSVLDSSLVIEVSWSQLIDRSKWECGWDEINHSTSSELINTKCEIRTTNCAHLSFDSGLTIPITNKIIRPWIIKT